MFSKDRPDCYIITENEKMKASFFSIPTYSSYITSHARIILLKALIANENNNVCYCDTDSIFLNGSFSGNVSDLVGDFKKEDKIVTIIRGLKNYTYIDNEGKINNVIKGLPKGSEQKKGTKVPTYEIKKYYKTKQAIDKNPGEPITILLEIAVARENVSRLAESWTRQAFDIKINPEVFWI